MITIDNIENVLRLKFTDTTQPSINYIVGLIDRTYAFVSDILTYEGITAPVSTSILDDIVEKLVLYSIIKIVSKDPNELKHAEELKADATNTLTRLLNNKAYFKAGGDPLWKQEIEGLNFE